MMRRFALVTSKYLTTNVANVASIQVQNTTFIHVYIFGFIFLLHTTDTIVMVLVAIFLQ